MYLVDSRGRNGAAKVLKTTSGSYNDLPTRENDNTRCFHAEVELLKKMQGAKHIVQLYGHNDTNVSISMIAFARAWSQPELTFWDPHTVKIL